MKIKIIIDDEITIEKVIKGSLKNLKIETNDTEFEFIAPKTTSKKIKEHLNSDNDNKRIVNNGF